MPRILLQLSDKLTEAAIEAQSRGSLSIERESRIKGESAIKGFENLIECESFDLTSGRRDIGSLEYGNGTQSSAPDHPIANTSRTPRKDKRTLGVDSLTLVRQLDRASPKLMQAAFKDPVEDLTAILYFFHSFPGTPTSPSDPSVMFLQPYLTIVLKNTQITQYDLKIEGSGSSAETIALAFDELKMTLAHEENGRRTGNIRGDIKMAGKA
ncbi:MAG TPA: type VI secretion system tube protein Hcp [Azospirillum sp.]|nr:type VI secretion system tube protein Hcp [Azospirillum sp.]